MSQALVILGAVGIACALSGLFIMAMTQARHGHWGMALTALAGMAIIIFLTLLGVETAEDFWKGRL